MNRIALQVLTLALAAQVAQAANHQNNQNKQEGNRKFAGINFGVGISVTADTGSRDRVSAASIDANGIVRVDKKDDVRARVMLETHAFVKTWGDPRRGVGPFIALQPGTDEIIEAIGIGVMFGFKRTDAEDSDSFNIGIGFVVDPAVRVLGDEFVENMPAPLDSMGNVIPVRFQERDQGGILLLGSFSWR